MKRSVLALAVALLLISVAVMADSKASIFLESHPYKGPSTMRDGRLLIPLAQYVSAMGLKSHQNGKTWCLTDPWHAESAPSGDASTLFLNGKPVANALVQIGDQTWIDVQAATEAMDGYYNVDKSLGMIDVGLAYHGAQGVRKMESVAASTAGSDVVVLHFFAHW